VKAIAKRLRRLEDYSTVNGKPRDRLRLVVRRMDRTSGLEGATCHRTLFPNGTLSEIVRLDKSNGGCEPTEDQLDRWIACLPIAAM
jgi:hypothetical protein